jgi:hypothetical protein
MGKKYVSSTKYVMTEALDVFDVELIKLSRKIVGYRYYSRPPTFDWYYDDYLYSGIRYLAIIHDKIRFVKWLHPYEFWVVSTGPKIQARRFFKVHFWQGKWISFDMPSDENVIFDTSEHWVIEDMIHKDSGVLSVMEMIRKIFEITHVLISPQFVMLARQAIASDIKGLSWTNMVSSMGDDLHLPGPI